MPEQLITRSDKVLEPEVLLNKVKQLGDATLREDSKPRHIFTSQ